MLDLFARHGSFDLTTTCAGDLHIDAQHTVEDVSITLGQAVSQALGNKHHIARYGHAYVPMDESLARAVLDLSGRFAFQFDANFNREAVGKLPTELVSHLWHSFAQHAAMNLHITVLYGSNTHHQVEATFKAVSRALRMAVRRDASSTRIPSTKGTL